jgi:hypothetical protein
MREDRYGNPITTSSAACVAAIDAYVEDMLGLRDGVAALAQQALAADPNCVLALTHMAALTLFQESAAGHEEALPLLQRARTFASKATERERLFLAAIEAWQQQAPGRMRAIHRQLAQFFPTDLFAAKLGQIHSLFQGDLDTVLLLATTAVTACPDDPFAHGMMAFALEECDRLDDAARHARAALELRRAEPWAQHAIAHVFEARGQAKQGLAFLGGLTEGWEACNSFAYTHNWWHMALFHLDLDEGWRARDIFDRHVWARAKDYAQDQLNAISLLLRLNIAGIDTGRRWADVAGHLRPRVAESILPFNDLHFIFGLARGGLVDEAATKLARLKADAAVADLYARRSWQEVAVPLGTGLLAYASGASAAAADALAPVIGRVPEMGGSHAQQDFFHLVYVDALCKADRRETAHALLRRRHADRPHLGWVKRALAGLQASQGSP